MRGLISVLGGLLALAVLVALIGLAVSRVETADQSGETREPRDAPPVCAYPVRDGNLEISECSHGEISGSYQDGGSVVSFSSRLAEAWAGPSPTRESLEGGPSEAAPWVTARVAVDGKVFVWTNDAKKRLSIFDGPDTSLTRKESEALVGAGNAVWRHVLHGEIKSWDRRDKLTAEQVWLTTTLGYISEAPANYEITDQTSRITGGGRTRDPAKTEE